MTLCYHGPKGGIKAMASNGSGPPLSVAHRRLIEALGSRIRDKRVLDAMARTPREAFVPATARDLVYEDAPLSIGHGQTISQPYIVAMMLEALDLKGTETVLEVGTGSGYQTALLAQLARRVVTVERIRVLAREAEKRIKALGLKNVKVEVTAWGLGCPAYAPYDGIIVSAGTPRIPKSLVDQLSYDGVMVLPVGTREEQDLKRVKKLESGQKVESLGACRFVPLIGEEVWSE